MARYIECDMCGEKIGGQKIVHRLSFFPLTSHQSVFDLCSTCKEKVVKMIRKGGKSG